MADNIPITAGSGTNVATDDISSVHYQRQKLIHGADGTNDGDVSSVNPLPSLLLPRLKVAAASAVTRPADTTAYAANDAVSNSTTAGSVTPITFTAADLTDAPVNLYRCRLESSGTGVASASFTLDFYRSDPTASSGVSGGDNAAYSVKKAGYIGSMSGTFKSFSDGAVAILVPDAGAFIVTLPTSGAATVYALMRTNTAFTPASGQTFTATLEVQQGRT